MDGVGGRDHSSPIFHIHCVLRAFEIFIVPLSKPPSPFSSRVGDKNGDYAVASPYLGRKYNDASLLFFFLANVFFCFVVFLSGVNGYIQT